jgi:hypothetical protein
MLVISRKAKTATSVQAMSSADPSIDSLTNASDVESFTKKRKPQRGRPNSVLRDRRSSQGDFDTLDQDEAATILGKSPKTLQRWRALGYGPPFELDGRYVSYSRAAIQAWKAEHNFRRTHTKVLRRND